MEGDKSIVARPHTSSGRKFKNRLLPLLKPMAELLVGLWLKDDPSVVLDAYPRIIEGIKNEGNDPADHRAFVLLFNAMRRAIVQLVWDRREEIQNGNTSSLPLDQVRTLSIELEEALMEAEIEVNQDFFESPENLAFLPLLRQRFESWLIGINVDADLAGEIGRKLELQFCHELESLYSEKESYFAQVKDKVTKKLPTSIAQSKYDYREKLITDWKKPIWGEQFGLDKLYIELNACYSVEKVGGNGRKIIEHHVVASEQYILFWLGEKKPEHQVMILRGGPGSGKSSLMKKIVYEVALQGDRPVYFFQLQHFVVTDDLKSDIHKYLDGMVDELREVPDVLGKTNLGKDRSPLLIFDGLDELSRSGSSGEQEAGRFLDNLNKLLKARASWSEWDIRILLTGRDFVIQKFAEPTFDHAARVLELLPFSIGDDENHPFEGIEGFKDYNFYSGLHLFEEDQRAAWWERFWSAKETLNQGVPPICTILDGSKNLSRQPLLSYLFAIVDLKEKFAEPASFTINALYEELIDSLRTREWGGKEGYKHSTFKDSNKENFLLLMEEMAVCAWHNGNVRITNLKRLEERFLNEDLKELLRLFKNQSTNSVTNLVVAFFAKIHGTVEEREDLIEFTHKSLGEYLVARRLVKVAKEVARTYNNQQQTDSIRNAKSMWLETCGYEPITIEIWNFVEQEAWLKPNLLNSSGKDELDARVIQSHLASLFSNLMNIGFQLEGMTDSNPIMKKIMSAETSLWMMISAFARVSQKETRITWKNKEQPKRILGWKFFYPALDFVNKGSLRVIFPEGANLNNGDYCEADFSYAILRLAELNFTNLSHSDLRFTDFHSANLYFADLHSADLRSACLTDADLTNANLPDAKFSDADLSNADFTNANLVEADLTDTNFTNASLVDADLTDAYLDGADFTNARCYPIRVGAKRLTGKKAYDYLVDRGAQNVPSPPKKKNPRN